MKKILVIEDDLDICNILSFSLRREGFDVSVANDGIDGLRKARELRPHLIVLDLMLPLLPGEEVCKAIREDDDPEFSRLPVVMLTAKASEADRIIGKVIGANHYMTKPFKMDELLGEVQKRGLL